WFTEGSTGGTFRNAGTLGEGWLERYGIDAAVHELNVNWIAGLKDYPSGRHWGRPGEQLARVFDRDFDPLRPGAGPRPAPPRRGPWGGPEGRGGGPAPPAGAGPPPGPGPPAVVAAGPLRGRPAGAARRVPPPLRRRLHAGRRRERPVRDAVRPGDGPRGLPRRP